MFYTQVNKLPIISFQFNGKIINKLIKLNNDSDAEAALWGPYKPLFAGKYICEFICQGINSNEIACDVVDNYGERIIVQRYHPEISNGKIIIYLELTESANFIEFRLYLEKNNNAMVGDFTITRLDGLMRLWEEGYINLRFQKWQADEATNSIKEKEEERYLMIQTADIEKYSEILNTSSIINKEYCKHHAFEYYSYSGTFFGDKPFHSTYNRTSILNHIITDGYRGWVFYLDADAIIVNHSFDLKKYLSDLRSSRKCCSLHPVHEENHHLAFFGNINAGAFAIDLSDPIARSVARAWYDLYRYYYQRDDYLKSLKWNDLMDDQTSIQRLLFMNRDALEGYINFHAFQHDFVFQALRSENSDESSEDEMKTRVSLLKNEFSKIKNI